ncbi:hypothetical protein, partial [Pseudomonas urmiensis]|uniref:hypothetical protein n=1 Tax=Pseudomonas urmiensis TaxID=2745493 RepID=UPI0034D5BD54
FNDREFLEYMGLLNSIEGFSLSSLIKDQRVWLGHKSGIFSCKSFFESIIQSSEDVPFVPYKMIWKVGIPPKVKVFAWLASWRRVNT